MDAFQLLISVICLTVQITHTDSLHCFREPVPTCSTPPGHWGMADRPVCNWIGICPSFCSQVWLVWQTMVQWREKNAFLTYFLQHAKFSCVSVMKWVSKHVLQGKHLLKDMPSFVLFHLQKPKWSDRLERYWQTHWIAPQPGTAGLGRRKKRISQIRITDTLYIYADDKRLEIWRSLSSTEI